MSPAAGGDGVDPEVGAPLGASLARVLHSLGGASADAMVVLVGRWEEVVGPVLVDRCGPADLSHGVLTVNVREPAFVPEVRFSATSIAQAACGVLGAPLVERVEVRVARS